MPRNAYEDASEHSSGRGAPDCRPPMTRGPSYRTRDAFAFVVVGKCCIVSSSLVGHGRLAHRCEGNGRSKVLLLPFGEGWRTPLQQGYLTDDERARPTAESVETLGEVEGPSTAVGLPFSHRATAREHCNAHCAGPRRCRPRPADREVARCTLEGLMRVVYPSGFLPERRRGVAAIRERGIA